MNLIRPSRALAFFFRVLGVLSLASSPCLADDDGPTPQSLAKVADAVAPSLVTVEYTLRYDKGDAPGSNARAAWQRAMMSASRDEASDDADYEGLIRDERPLVRAGYLLSDGRVVTRDPRIHPRFIASIAVRSGEQSVPATIDAYARTQDALFLKPGTAPPKAQPLSFDAKAPGPFAAVNYVLRSGAWTIGVGSAPSSARAERASTRRYSPAPGEVLIVDSAGKGVGMSFTGELPLDGTWKGSPADWPAVSAAEMNTLLGTLEKATASSLPRVEVRFRSPRGGGGGESGRRFRASHNEDGDDQTTEWNGTGILINPSTVLVLADFKPKLTGRLETVLVHGADGKAVPATFVATLKDFTGFLVSLASPMSGEIRLATGPITDVRNTLLLKSEIGVLGEARTPYFWRDRVESFSTGWKGRLYPDAEAGRASSRPWENEPAAAQNFLFDLEGHLVCVPLAHRERVASQERYSYRDQSDAMIPGSYLAEVLAGKDGAVDPENRPLSEEEENRLAWLGVELQAMDPDLARVNKVVDQTGGGRTGAMVTFLYPDSPAAAAGIEVGDILLRLHVQGQPKPLDVEIQPGMEGMFDQFWAMYDRMPDEYFDQIPQPWGSAENTLTRALTDIGFGTPFTIDIFREGKVLTKDMKITQGPAHYDAAKRFKSEAAGITVRDLTYEVRRYFQLKPDDAGVILSKIEKGGRGAVAGLKPYEIITSVNDKPVRTVADFEKAIAGDGEFRLSVKRMTEGRLVKLKVGGPGATGARNPGDAADPAGQEAPR